MLALHLGGRNKVTSRDRPSLDSNSSSNSSSSNISNSSNTSSNSNNNSSNYTSNSLSSQMILGMASKPTKLLEAPLPHKIPGVEKRLLPPPNAQEAVWLRFGEGATVAAIVPKPLRRPLRRRQRQLPQRRRRKQPHQLPLPHPTLPLSQLQLPLRQCPHQHRQQRQSPLQQQTRHPRRPPPLRISRGQTR